MPSFPFRAFPEKSSRPNKQMKVLFPWLGSAYFGVASIWQVGNQRRNSPSDVKLVVLQIERPATLQGKGPRSFSGEPTPPTLSPGPHPHLSKTETYSNGVVSPGLQTAYLTYRIDRPFRQNSRNSTLSGFGRAMFARQITTQQNPYL